MKSSTGRLREACVAEVHRLRGAYDAEGRARAPMMTYQAIAETLNISLGTVYNIATGRTHVDEVPLGHPKHHLTVDEDDLLP